MNTCTSCGAQILEGQEFCSKCGGAVPGVEGGKSGRVNVKKTILTNIIPLICLIIGIIMLIIGLGNSYYNDYIYHATEYVGGDAYNYIIESNFQSALNIINCIEEHLYIAVGVLVGCMSLLKMKLVRV